MGCPINRNQLYSVFIWSFASRQYVCRKARVKVKYEYMKIATNTWPGEILSTLYIPNSRPSKGSVHVISIDKLYDWASYDETQSLCYEYLNILNVNSYSSCLLQSIPCCACF